MGARLLRRAIQRYIEDPLADEVLSQSMPPGSTVEVDRLPRGTSGVKISVHAPSPKREPVGVGGGGESDEGGGDAGTGASGGGDLPDDPEVLPDVPDAPPAPGDRGDDEQLVPAAAAGVDTRPAARMDRIRAGRRTAAPRVVRQGRWRTAVPRKRGSSNALAEASSPPMSSSCEDTRRSPIAPRTFTPGRRRMPKTRPGRPSSYAASARE